MSRVMGPSAAQRTHATDGMRMACGSARAAWDDARNDREGSTLMMAVELQAVTGSIEARHLLDSARQLQQHRNKDGLHTIKGRQRKCAGTYCI